MKFFALFACLLCVPAFLSAQLIEEEFEEWTQENTAEVPVGWTSSNFGSGRTSDAFSGGSAASVWNWYSYALGTLSIGETSPLWFDLNHAGIPINSIPSKLTGYYKYELGQNQGNFQENVDSAAVYVLLKRYNPQQPGSVDTISFVTHLFPPSDSWQPFEVDLPLQTVDVEPDSIAIVFFSSNPNNIARCGPDSMNCSYLSVDQLALVATSGVPLSLREFTAPVQVLPNPVQESARLEFAGDAGQKYQIKIHGMSGSLVAEWEVVGAQVDFSNLRIPSGAYHVSILDAQNIPVAAGRFVVE